MSRFPSKKNVTLRCSHCVILSKLAMDMDMGMAMDMVMETDMDMVMEKDMDMAMAKDMERALNKSASRSNKKHAEMCLLLPLCGPKLMLPTLNPLRNVSTS